MTTLDNSTSDAEASRVMFDRQSLNLRTAIPGVVVAVSANGTTVDVQPAVSMAQTLDGETRGIAMPVLTGVPLFMGGSTTLGLFVSYPVQPGDDGILVVCDRAIDNWQHGEGVAMAPLGPSPRHHDLTDAVFIHGRGRMRAPLSLYNPNALELRNQSGTVSVSVTNDGVTITSPTTTVNGNLSVVGTVIDGNGVNLGTHVHTGGDGGGNTGAPVT